MKNKNYLLLTLSVCVFMTSFLVLPTFANASWITSGVRHMFGTAHENDNGSAPQLVPLTVSCVANPSQVSINYPVTFEPVVSGGTGFYTYSWSGDCNASSITCLRSFSQPGFRTAVLTVTSGDQTKLANCSVSVSGYYNCGDNNQDPNCYNYAGLDLNYLTAGDLYASSTSARVGEPFTITISGRDNNGLYSLRLYYKRNWHSENFSGTNITTATRSWEIIENSPGLYRYCGEVVGYKGEYNYTGRETIDTSPACIEVNVSNGNYQSCSGDTSCGYGVCASNQRPNWYWSGGTCSYNCVNDSQCGWNACECTSGACCDGCHYKNSSTSCNFETQSEYSCPWGAGCGSNVGKRIRTRLQYCSGNNSQCNGNWGGWLTWTDWTVADVCSANTACLEGSSQCQAKSSCAQPAVFSNYVKNAKKACYGNSVYWFDSNNVRQGQYQNCSDNNECTQDKCQNGQCVNEVKCDGTTCKIDSDAYCKTCNHCGDGVCSCGETSSSCAQDCKEVGEALRGLRRDASFHQLACRGIDASLA